MRIRAGIIGAAVAGLALSAHASIYASMAVPGTHNGWNTAPSMTLVGGAGNVWVCTQTFSSASGDFKFAANGNWDTNWGGNASLARVPAIATAISQSDSNLKYAGLSNGNYRITFNDSTREFRIDWVGAAPLPPPAIGTLSLVGDFNGWNTAANPMTNHPAPATNVWSVDLDLYSATTFQFFPDGTWSNQFGAPEATTVLVPGLGTPATNSACGKSDFTLSGFVPGTFRFELNATNNLFTVVQTATQAFTIATMTVQGNFIGTNKPPPNMMRLGTTSSWESDHHVTNSGAITLRFAANSGMQIWGATNVSPLALPAAGTLVAGTTAYAQVSGISTGRYRITFDHQTGNFSFRQVYLQSSGLNLLKNPGFEQTTQPDGGDAVDWGSWQAWPKDVANGYAPHSGSWCGALHGQLFPDWTDYASFAQDVLVDPGKTYRASGWFKATPEWTATTMQIKIEWLDAANAGLGGDAIALIPALTTNWVKFSAEGVAPANAAKAHVVFLCSEAGDAGTMHVDDVEMRVVAGRTQNFDTWGSLTAFGPFSPDWSVTSGKVVYNVPPGRPPAEVLISQYVEGTGNNKAIEIYNGTLASIALTNYFLQQYDNGATNPSVSIQLAGSLGAGETVVVGRPGTPTNYAPDGAIGLLPNLYTNKYLTFNGDDVIVLRQGSAGGTVKDRVGQVGTNASGSIWSRNTKNRTLTRKSTVFTGTVGAVTAAFPLLEEWDIAAGDTFTGLGEHEISYLDPNEPYTPAGYSLLMNTNAVLMSGDLPGGVGDVSFWYRTESMNPPVTVSIETAPAVDGPWITNATLENVARSNFTYYVASVDRADALYLRIRQTNGGTNRFRIDEIAITEPSGVKRFEDFLGWTDPAYEIPGSYSRYGWSIQSAAIAPTTGLDNTRAALLSPADGAVVSPAYGDGVGETIFWCKAYESDSPAYLLLQTSIDGGSNWVTQGSFNCTTAVTYSTWLYLPDEGAQARIVFDPAQSSGEALIDNVECRAPALYRNQNFDGWPYKPSYTSGTAQNQGWTVGNCIVDAQVAYVGMAARLNTAVTGSAYIQSPYLPDGIGSISYRMCKVKASDANPSVQVQVSTNGTAWTTIATHTATSTNWTQFVYFREDSTNHVVRFVHSAGASAVPIDDILIGSPQPRPEVSIAPGIDPAAPASNETVQITADVVARYGASILSVTGWYRIAYGSWIQVPMVPVAYGSYAASTSIPAQNAGTEVRYYVKVQYAGIGAAPASTGFTTNLATSVTNLYKISSVRKGDVWINEVSYLNLDEWEWEEISEYVELCGVAGVSISNWTIQLAFGSDADIALNGGQPVYANYKLTAGHTFTNQTNGFSFFVLGDQQLLDAGLPVNRVLTTTVPTNVAPNSDIDGNHLHNSRGVIRLLNEFSNMVYSLSYEGYAAGSDPVLAYQELWTSNSVSLVGTGSTTADFDWETTTDMTLGRINAGQTLIPPDDPELGDFRHVPEWLVTPISTNLAPFTMRDPSDAQSKDQLWIHAGFPAALYDLPDGTLFYRAPGAPAWTDLAMNVRQGANDTNGFGYIAATIPSRTFDRGATIEYVIQANPNETGVSTTYLGAGGSNGYQLCATLAEAEVEPFTYTFAIRSEIFVTNMAANATNWLLYTLGNDVVEPFVNFKLYGTTNLLAPTNTWFTNAFTNSFIDAFGQNVFVVPKRTNLGSKVFYRIDPLWP